jgi:beta-glucanase (GH16 family)
MTAPPRTRKPGATGVVAVVVAVAVLALVVTVGATRRGASFDFAFPGAPCGGHPLIRLDGAARSCTFDDEFDGSRLDPGHWQVTTTAQNGFHSGSECYVDDGQHVAVRGGRLLLTATRSAAFAPCSVMQTPYESGMVSSTGRFAQTYGRFEIRAKLPHVPGIQPALWMYPQTEAYGHWPDSGEIDIAEIFGSPNGQTWPHLHYLGADGSPAQPGRGCTLHRDASGYHTYTVDWAPRAIRFAYDNATCLTVSGWQPSPPLRAPAPFDKPFYLLLELALGVGANQPSAATPLPVTMSVDYVRVWG